MVKAPRGYRHRTRKLLKKSIRERGAIPPLSLLMYEYSVGDRVHIVINPSITKGMPHRRFHGKTGVVVGKRGYSYIVKVEMGNKEKILFVRPEHLRPVMQSKPPASTTS
ncbi:MAG: 50S ribosomal protein L21e [Desulfurococcaceae archaeon]